MLEVWQVSAAARGVLTVAFLWISILVTRNLTRGRQWRRNPLGVATWAVFAAEALRNLSHFIHAFDVHPTAPEQVQAARAILESPALGGWSIVAAGVVLLYLFPRARRDIMDPAALGTRALARRQHEALRLQEMVVSRLDRAAKDLGEGRVEQCRQELDEALASSRSIVADMLPKDGRRAGRLRARRRRHG